MFSRWGWVQRFFAVMVAAVVIGGALIAAGALAGCRPQRSCDLRGTHDVEIVRKACPELFNA